LRSSIGICGDLKGADFETRSTRWISDIFRVSLSPFDVGCLVSYVFRGPCSGRVDFREAAQLLWRRLRISFSSWLRLLLTSGSYSTF
jgi:hypothetical protein